VRLCAQSTNGRIRVTLTIARLALTLVKYRELGFLLLADVEILGDDATLKDIRSKMEQRFLFYRFRNND